MNLIERYRTELEQICTRHHLLLDNEVLSDRRDKYIRSWRIECYAYLRWLWFTLKHIWESFNKNHSAILYSLRMYPKYKNLWKEIKV